MGKRFSVVYRGQAAGKQLELLPVADEEQTREARHIGEVLSDLGETIAAGAKIAPDAWWNGCKWDD